jgi:hypothetical protein
MNVIKSISLILLVFFVTPEYSKTYYDNGVLKSEGWIINNMKEKYWYYYFKDGSIKSEGHFENDVKTDYWFFYNKKGDIVEQGNFDQGQKSGWWKIHHGDTIEEVRYIKSNKEGLSIYRLKGKPVKAEFYRKNIKTHVWYSLKAFKKEYPNL